MRIALQDFCPMLHIIIYIDRNVETLRILIVKIVLSQQLQGFQDFTVVTNHAPWLIRINVNDYVEHRAEVLQSYAQKLAQRALEDRRSQHTDPMSNSERKIIHRIISRIDGVTSYSEGDEPNRYVVVDVDSE